MAAVVPTHVLRESMGSLTLHIVRLPSTLDATNTWASGIPGIVSWQISATDAPGTQTNSGIAASLSGSTFTFTPDEDNQGAELWVLSRS